MVGSGSGKFDRIRIREKGPDPQHWMQDRKGCRTRRDEEQVGGGTEEMQDRRDEEQIGFMTRGIRTGGMQDRKGCRTGRDPGQVGCGTGEMQDRRDEEQDGFMTGQMQDRSNAGLVG